MGPDHMLPSHRTLQADALLLQSPLLPAGAAGAALTEVPQWEGLRAAFFATRRGGTLRLRHLRRRHLRMARKRQ